jgi:hypothetical protein
LGNLRLAAKEKLRVLLDERSKTGVGAAFLLANSFGNWKPGDLARGWFIRKHALDRRDQPVAPSVDGLDERGIPCIIAEGVSELGDGAGEDSNLLSPNDF